jgi:predicted nucleic acid binding AN1-type Zn finger protein
MKKKCHFCNKKLSIIEKDLTCQCKFQFCMKHMNKHSHNCTFDTKKVITEQLKENNPKISCNKIN